MIHGTYVRSKRRRRLLVRRRVNQIVALLSHLTIS
jgi:hypothetical protein